MKTSELRNLIKRLGGRASVGRVCGCSPTAVSHWKVVPPEHAYVIERLARERKVLRSDGSPYLAAELNPLVAERLGRIATDSSLGATV